MLSASRRARSLLSKDSPEKGCALRAGGQCVSYQPSTLKAPPKMIRRIRSRRIALMDKLSGVNLTGVRPRFDVPALYAPTSSQSKIWFSGLIRFTCISH